jgi:PAS domain S-box-containing protein
MWSSQMYENFGMSAEPGPPDQEKLEKVFHPEDLAIYRKNFCGALKGIPYDQVARVQFHSGKTRFVHTQGYPKTDDSGEFIGLIGTSQDITEQILAERALRESEEKYRRIFENSVVGFFQSTPEGRFITANSAFAKMLGYESPEELVSSVTDIATESYADPKDRDRYRKVLLREGKVDGFQFKARGKDGSEIWVSESTRAIFDPAGKPIRYEGVVSDITDRIRMEAELQQSEQRYRSLVENTMDGYFVCEIPSGRILFLNQRICDLFNYAMSEALKLTIWDFIDPKERPRLQQGVQDRILGRGPNFSSKIYTVFGKDKLSFTAEVSTSLTTYQGRTVIQGLLRDVTEKQRLQQQLQQAQKFEAIGTLAGGVAHDFNNLLMGIQGRASLIAMETGSSQTLREHISAIEEYVHSATHLTRQLLGFSRGGKYEVKPIEINELLLYSADMFGRTRKELRIHTKPCPADLVVEADKQQIEQVLLNIFVNAWQAMPEGGELYLETSEVRFDLTGPLPQGLDPGPYVKLSITDTGVGMDEGVRQRIFDPFFTTKEKSRGTGLGLASAYGIARNHGGTITVQSERGHGSTFTIYLPLSERCVHREEEMEEPLEKGTETVLLVDDEEIIQEVAGVMLEKLGYSVIAATSGKAAVDAVDRRGDGIDMVILDLIMPGMDGARTFERIRQLRPALPVLISSGYAIDGQASELLKKGASGFIQKPFNVSALSKKLREVIKGA